MRPVYMCQLPDKMQEELRGILERILLYHCGSVEKAEEYFGTSLEEAVQNGMDSKIVDVDCVIDSLWSGGELASDAPVDLLRTFDPVLLTDADQRIQNIGCR